MRAMNATAPSGDAGGAVHAHVRRSARRRPCVSAAVAVLELGRFRRCSVIENCGPATGRSGSGVAGEVRARSRKRSQSALGRIRTCNLLIRRSIHA